MGSSRVCPCLLAGPTLPLLFLFLCLVTSPAQGKTCTRTIRFGTFDEATPYAVLPVTQWLDNETSGICWTYFREASGGRSVQHLDSGDLDVAMVGSTPYSTAVARRAKLTAVLILQTNQQSLAVVVRQGLSRPRDLAPTASNPRVKLWTPRFSTAHYTLLAGLEEMGFSRSDVEVQVRSPQEIVAAWDRGEIDGAACWGNTRVHLLTKNDGKDNRPGHVLFDSSTVAPWGYRTLNVLAVSNRFLQQSPELVQYAVDKIIRATADWLRLSGQTAEWVGEPVSGPYNDLVGRFLFAECYGPRGSGRSTSCPQLPGSVDELKAVATRTANYGYLPATGQVGANAYPLGQTIHRQARFLWAMKLLANEPPAEAYFTGAFNTAYLNDAIARNVAAQTLASNPDPLPVATQAPIQYFPPSTTAGLCGSQQAKIDAYASPAVQAFTDGSPDERAYEASKTCSWVVEATAGVECLALTITYLSSEPPYDALEVFSNTGRLLGRFSGRSGVRSNPSLRGCAWKGSSATPPVAAPPSLAGLVAASPADAYPVNPDNVAFYVRWATDAHDELLIGEAERVGFTAQVVQMPNPGTCSCGAHGRQVPSASQLAGAATGCACACDPGYGGSSCDVPYCFGVETQTAASAAAGGVSGGTARAAAPGATEYQPYSRCGWELVPATGEGFVHIRFTSFALEDGFDFLRIFSGGAPKAYVKGIETSSTASSTASSSYSVAPPNLLESGDYALQVTGGGSQLPNDFVVQAPAFITFESDGATNFYHPPASSSASASSSSSPSFGGFELTWSGRASICTSDLDCNGRGSCVGSVCQCNHGYYGLTCTYDHCVGETVLPGVTSAGRIDSGVADSYAASTQCTWVVDLGQTALAAGGGGGGGEAAPEAMGTLSGGTLIGVRLAFTAFDLEGTADTTEIAETTDAVEVYALDGASGVANAQMSAALKTYTQDVEAPLTSSTLSVAAVQDVQFPTAGSQHRFAVIFRSDKNNIKAHRGFDLQYSALYSGDRQRCDYTGSGATDQPSASGGRRVLSTATTGNGAFQWTCLTAEAPECKPDGFCGPKSSSSDGLQAYVIIIVVVAVVVVFGVIFFIYRRQKIKTSRAQKMIIRAQQDELQGFKDSVVGMRTCTQQFYPRTDNKGDYITVDVQGAGAAAAAAGGGGVQAVRAASAVSAGPPTPQAEPPGQWYWEESAGNLHLHDPSQVKAPNWIAYGETEVAALEQAYRSGDIASPVPILGGGYVVDLAAMTQRKLATGFERNVLREGGPVPSHAEAANRQGEGKQTNEETSSSSSSSSSRKRSTKGGGGGEEKRELFLGGDREKVHSRAPEGEGAPKFPADLRRDGEDMLALSAGTIVQIAKQRADDGWAFGSVVLQDELPGGGGGGGGGAAGVPDLPEGWSFGSGWFPMSFTEAPSLDELSRVQESLGAGAGGADALKPPDYWDEVDEPEVAQLNGVDKKTDEYRRVTEAFLLNLDKKRVKIHSVQRVQNMALWQSYAVKLGSSLAREEDPVAARRRFVRVWLFHGAPADVIPKILQQGFNRSFCGKNATFYGKGVYFARDSSYSAYKLYCRPDDHGVQSIFLCRVVVGEFCKGVRDGLTPDVRDAERNILYDSTVNDVNNPEIFVTYHDAQAYPEYLIRFTQSGPDPKEHPKTGNAPHPNYKPHALLSGMENFDGVSSPGKKRDASVHHM